MLMSDAKVALVTGATRGIGKAIATTLAQRGYTVVGTATTDEGVATIGAALKQLENLGDGLRLDVTDGASIVATMTAIQARFGGVGVLVNNAGITRDNLVVRMSDNEWDAIMNTNLKAAFRLSKAVLRGMMKARQGRIINVGSVVGSSGNAGQANYSAAKAGLIGFTKALALEVGSRAITVNCVAPGFVDTDMTQALSEDIRAKLLEHIPLARLGTPADIANAVAFLASDEAAYITGVTLHVNGGMYMT
jgi:3-oxoacyl-[acyl-carrier protein] reductase